MNSADPNEQTGLRQLSRPALVLAATLAIWCSAASPAFAQKTDVVELINGDRITCEIQKLDRGKLSVKTDGLGTISIEWDDVARVSSTAAYDVELESGSRVSGTLSRGEPRAVQVVTAAGPEPIALATIVRVSRLGRTFWRRLDGSIATGFSFAQANVQTQWTFDADIDYRSRNWFIGVTADSMLTTREDVDSQKRADLIVQAQRFFRPRWSYMALGVAQRNEELSLDLRWAAGGGLVRVFKQTNRTALQAELGLAYTHEQYSGSTARRVGEAISGVSWDWFTFDGKSTNLSFDALSFVALDRDSRLRLELNTTFKSDIVGDLYWSVNAFESYNSDPPDNRKASDFGVSATLGWTF